MPNYEILYRSTTPKIILHINDPEFNMEDISVCHVTIENDSGRNKKIFEHPSINYDDRTIALEMTQEETASFEPGYIHIQLKIKTQDGLVIASKVITTTIHDILEEEVL